MGTINDKLQYLAETKAQLEDALLDKGLTPSSNLRENVGMVENYTTDASATANDIINPKTAYVNGQKITGAIIPTYEPSIIPVNNQITNNTGVNIFDLRLDLGLALAGSKNGTSIYVCKIINNEINLNEGNFYEITRTNINEQNGLNTSVTLQDCKFSTSSIIDNQENLVYCIFSDWRTYRYSDMSINSASEYTFSIYFDINNLAPYLINNKFATNTVTIVSWSAASYRKAVDFSAVIKPTDSNKYLLLPTGRTSNSNEVGYIRRIELNTSNNTSTSTNLYTMPSSLTNIIWQVIDNKIMYSSNGSGKILNIGISTAEEVTNFTDYVTNNICLLDDYYLKGNELYDYSNNLIKTYSNTFNSASNLKRKLRNNVYEFNVSTGVTYIFSFNDVTQVFTQESSNSQGISNYTGTSSLIDSNPYIVGNQIIYKKSATTSFNIDVIDNSNIITKLNRLNTEFVDTASGSATSGDILISKTAYVGGNKVTGTMPNNGALNYTPTTTQQTIPAGYTSGGTVSGDANLVTGNIKSGTSIFGVNGSVVELNGETKTITPTTSQQTITPTSPKNAITEITVNAVTSTIDSNIQAENIKDGVTILGVTGTYTGSIIASTLPSPVAGISILELNTEYYLGTQTSISIAFPQASEGDYCYLNFTAGENAIITFNGNNLIGDTSITLVEDNDYEIFATYNGTNWVIQYLEVDNE